MSPLATVSRMRAGQSHVTAFTRVFDGYRQVGIRALFRADSG